MLIAVAAAAISILWAVHFRPPQLRFDENYYFPLAQGIVAGAYEDGYVIRAPLYPLFLAGVFKVLGQGFTAALIVQALIRGLVVAGVALMGRRYLSRSAGIAAALLLAFYPPLISLYMSFLTEVIYIPLFLLSFCFVERAARTEHAPAAAWAGLACGLAALARATSFFLTFVLAVWFVLMKPGVGGSRSRNILRAALLVAVMLAVISPWTVRNAVVHEGFIPIGDDTAFNLYLITSGMRIRQASTEWQSWGAHPERQREAYARWLSYLKEDPAFHIKRLGVVLPRIFNTSWESPVRRLSTLEGGSQPREVPALRALFGVLHPLTFWLIMAGGLVGLFALERDRTRMTLVIIALAYFILIHGMTLARARFMLPLACVLAIYSGGLVATVLRRLGSTMRARRCG
jgi:4-amino-4-deoxy-L-arabinose transferase-like glycosyltransferase